MPPAAALWDGREGRLMEGWGWGYKKGMKRFLFKSVLVVLIGLLMCASFAVARQEPPATQPAGDKPVLVDVSDKAAVDAAMDKEVFLEGVVESAAWAPSGKVMRIA